MASMSRIQKGLKLWGQSGTFYTLVSSQRRHPNVWTAFRSGDETDPFIIKFPQDDTDTGKQELEKEMQMHNLFKHSEHIRKMIDFVPARSHRPAMIVLEPFEKTLWSARAKRPLAIREIKYVMKSALLGLRDLHRQGFVHCDFKMENVLLNGFDNVAACDDDLVPLRINAKLADLGSVMTPGHGQVTAITYRSPEVYFHKPWNSAIDIWAWGIVYFHLLQARIAFSSPGIYDSILKGGTLEQKAKAVQASLTHDFNLRETEYFRDCDFSVLNDVQIKLEMEHWTDRLCSLGVPANEVIFLYAVLQPDPSKRMTAEEILEIGYLDV